MSALTGWIVAYLARWLPHRAPTGLFPVGAPDERSPVIVTANFSLTVKRVRRALAGQNLWLLVANSEGINVWCAATGGIFTENRVIDAIKVSRLSEKVSHHQVILPALSAPGIDRDAVKQETGFRCRFGPVFARDVPAYLAGKNKKPETMRRFDFGARHRLDMFIPMNLPIYLLAAIPIALIAPAYLPGFTALFWGAVAVLYTFLDVIPGKTGWGQALFAGALVAAGWAALDVYSQGDPLAHWGWLLTTLGVFFGAGFDLAGILSPRTSDAEEMMRRLGFKRFASLYVDKHGDENGDKNAGRVRLDREACRGCLTCSDVCPVGVFGGDEARKKTKLDKKIALVAPTACFACGACVKQCPEGALSLGAAGHA